MRLEDRRPRSCPDRVVRDIIPGRGIPAGGVAPRSNTAGILVAPCHPGAALRDLCHDPRGQDTSGERGSATGSPRISKEELTIAKQARTKQGQLAALSPW